MADPDDRTGARDEESKAVEPSSAAEETAPPAPALSAREMALLRARRRVAERRPRFRREESWRYAKLDPGWRRPRGGTSKMRLSVKGWPARVKAGYRGPKAVRGLSPLGFREVRVHGENELQKLDPRRDAVRIAHTVGARRRASILERARSLQLRVVNPGVAETEAAPGPEEKREA